MRVTDHEFARALDDVDPLACYRSRFVGREDGLIYLDGNSLGRLPVATAERLASVVSGEWGGELIGGWDHWMELPSRVGDVIGVGLLGARSGEVIVCDSTTVNLYKLLRAALAVRPGRRAVISDTENFPTDRYVLEGLVAGGGLDMRWLEPDPVAGPQVDEVAAVIDEQVAVVTLSHVAYRSAAIADLAAITALAHDAGALVLWDLSHSGGSVPVGLAEAGADLAVGCTYKYLNGGPGAPAYLYVRAELVEQVRSPIWGWIGQRELFTMGPAYDPQPDVRRFLAGTPPVLGLVAVEVGASMLVEAGLDRLWQKSQALTSYAVDLYDAWLAPLGFELGSPRPAERRGSHVTLRHPDAEELCRALVRAGVIPDFRPPDSVRFGLAPLTTSFADVHRGMARLADLAAVRS